jgi:hypothetical protein
MFDGPSLFRVEFVEIGGGHISYESVERRKVTESVSRFVRNLLSGASTQEAKTARTKQSSANIVH